MIPSKKKKVHQRAHHYTLSTTGFFTIMAVIGVPLRPENGPKNRAKNGRFSLLETVGIVPATATGNCLLNLRLSYNMLAGFDQFSRGRFQLSRASQKPRR